VNKFILMLVLTSGGMLAGLIRGPYIPLVVYYFYAVLRPQFIWKWQLAQFPELGWSFYVAGATLITYVPWVLGVIGPLGDPLRRVFPPFVLAHKLMVAFSIWVSLSYAYANNMDWAWITYQEFLKIAVMYFVATQVIRSFTQIWGLYIVVTFALAYIALEVNQLYFESQYLLLYKAGFAGLDNNGAGLMMAMGIPLCYFAWEFTKGWHRWIFLAAVPLIIHAVVSSYSRGAMVACLPPAAIAMLYTRRRRFLLVCWGVTALALPVVAGKEIQDRFSTVSEAEEDGSFQSRLDSWDAGRRIANQYPFFGAGVRCSNLISHEYGADTEGRTIHSQYLQIAADNGWCGLILYLGLLYAVLISIWRTRIRLWPRTDPESVRAVAMLGGIECAIWTFAIGAAALSMETFELTYLMFLLGAQAWAITNAVILRPEVGLRSGPVPYHTARPQS
jgi:probable O-glycosylation ligase (exosortase A-associated)